MNHAVIWPQAVSRRSFLRSSGIASSALTLSPFFLERLTSVSEAASSLTRVYKVMNGTDCFQNIAKLWELMGGAAAYISPTDIVVIKGNAQWPNQGYTHTGCIKAVIDQILAIPGFSGEIHICDNVQGGGWYGNTSSREHNWPDHSWESLAALYRANGKPVTTKKWANGPWRNISFPGTSVWNPADGEGWTRSFFSSNGRNTYISYPIFQSSLRAGRMVDLKNGVWENGAYTGQRVKVICMPTLNNHGSGGEDYAGITSAIKSFFGATEIHNGDNATFNGYYHIHSSSMSQASAQAAGELVGRFINTMYSPILYITAAMWSGYDSRTGGAVATNTVLACTNPVTLDYVACRDVISPYAAWLNPDQNNNTRKQIVGCNSQGIGTIDPSMFQIVTYDFNHPATTRLDIDRKVRDFKGGTATQQNVKDVINQYMQGP
jgi:hypothetical protein